MEQISGGQVMGAADMVCLVSACPNIQTLSIPEQAMKGDPADMLVPLSTLASLRGLCTEEVGDAALSAIAQLTRLTALWVEHSSSAVPAAGLLPLISLKQLSSLSIVVNGHYEKPETFATIDVSAASFCQGVDYATSCAAPRHADMAQETSSGSTVVLWQS